ncbi:MULTISPECIES: hypothetical protein [Streptomyces]|uniref:Uncharacterized protein n=1 Tax=Streptomyces galilaeus TaxID=33899 RepID=A0ABW9IYL2_STRGJ
MTDQPVTGMSPRGPTNLRVPQQAPPIERTLNTPYRYVPYYIPHFPEVDDTFATSLRLSERRLSAIVQEVYPLDPGDPQAWLCRDPAQDCGPSGCWLGLF